MAGGSSKAVNYRVVYGLVGGGGVFVTESQVIASLASVARNRHLLRCHLDSTYAEDAEQAAHALTHTHTYTNAYRVERQGERAMKPRGRRSLLTTVCMASSSQ